MKKVLENNFLRMLRSKKFVWTVAFALIMGFVGSGFGIAGFGTAISGFIPGVLLGGTVGYALAAGYRIKKEDYNGPR